MHKFVVREIWMQIHKSTKINKRKGTESPKKLIIIYLPSMTLLVKVLIFLPKQDNVLFNKKVALYFVPKSNADNKFMLGSSTNT